MPKSAATTRGPSLLMVASGLAANSTPTSWSSTRARASAAVQSGSAGRGVLAHPVDVFRLHRREARRRWRAAASAFPKPVDTSREERPRHPFGAELGLQLRRDSPDLPAGDLVGPQRDGGLLHPVAGGQVGGDFAGEFGQRAGGQTRGDKLPGNGLGVESTADGGLAGVTGRDIGGLGNRCQFALRAVLRHKSPGLRGGMTPVTSSGQQPGRRAYVQTPDLEPGSAVPVGPGAARGGSPALRRRRPACRSSARTATPTRRGSPRTRRSPTPTACCWRRTTTSSACSTARACRWRRWASPPARWGPVETDPRAVWRLFAANYHLFRGTPSAHVARTMSSPRSSASTSHLEADTADLYFDRIGEALATPGVPAPRPVRAVQYRGDGHHRESRSTTSPTTRRSAPAAGRAGWSPPIAPIRWSIPSTRTSADSLARFGEMTGRGRRPLGAATSTRTAVRRAPSSRRWRHLDRPRPPHRRHRRPAAAEAEALLRTGSSSGPGRRRTPSCSAPRC